MKKIIYVLLLLVITIITANSCKKDDDPVVTPALPTNYVEHNAKKYYIDTCFYEYKDNLGNNMHLYQIYLVPKTIGCNTWMGSLVGTGNGMTFQVITNSMTSFNGSNFAIDTLSSNYKLNLLLNAELRLNYDFFMEDGQVIDMHHGNLSVINQGGLIQLITGNLVDENGLPLKVYFKGVPAQVVL